MRQWISPRNCLSRSSDAGSCTSLHAYTAIHSSIMRTSAVYIARMFCIHIAQCCVKCRIVCSVVFSRATSARNLSSSSVSGPSTVGVLARRRPPGATGRRKPVRESVGRPNPCCPTMSMRFLLSLIRSATPWICSSACCSCAYSGSDGSVHSMIDCKNNGYLSTRCTGLISRDGKSQAVECWRDRSSQSRRKAAAAGLLVVTSASRAMLASWRAQ